MISRISRLSCILSTVVITMFVGMFFASYIANPVQAAGINSTINFQGKLTTPSGSNVANSTYTVVFSLYTQSSNGTAQWTETQSVTTTNGIFRVSLGSVASFSGFDFNQENLYLGIKVGTDAEMTPRVQFNAVPYAFNAQKVNGLSVTAGSSSYLNIAANHGLVVNSTTILNAYTKNGGLLYSTGYGTIYQTEVGSSGQCLKSYGSGSPYWDSCAATDTVVGTGSAGQLAFWDGSYSQASDAALNWDNDAKTLNLSRSGSQGDQTALNVSTNLTDSGIFGAQAIKGTAYYNASGYAQGITGGSYEVWNQASGGTVGYAQGFTIWGGVESGATINNFYGFRLSDLAGDGSIGRSVGIVIDDLSKADNNTLLYLGSEGNSPDGDYSIYSSSTKDSYLAGSLTIDGTTSLQGLQLNAGTIEGAGLSDDCSSSSSKLLWSASTKQFSCGTDGASVAIVKSANQSVTNSTTLVDDTELQFTAGANETWIVEIVAQGGIADTPDAKMTIAAPAGSTCANTLVDNNANTNTTAMVGCGTAMVASGNNVNDAIYVYGTVTVGNTPGTIKFQFTQNTSSASATTIAAGSYLKAFKVSGADLAEIYYATDPTIGPGSVVALDPQATAGVVKASTANAGHTLGVVSTQPGMVIGDATLAAHGRPVALALAGRVPVNVISQNGPIKAGDNLSPSAVPGVAMKANGTGPIIGQALSAYDGYGVGQVVAFIKNSSAAAQVTTSSQPTDATLAQVDQLKTQASDLAASLDSLHRGLAMNNDQLTVKVAMTVDGQLQANNGLVVAGPAEFRGPAIFKALAQFIDTAIFRKQVTFEDHVAFSSDTVGTAKVAKGQDRVQVTFSKPYADKPVVSATIIDDKISASGLVEQIQANVCAYGDSLEVCQTKMQQHLLTTDSRYLVTNIEPTGFTILLDGPAPQNYSFSWSAFAQAPQDGSSH